MQLRWSKEKPVRETLRIWPALPIVVSGTTEDIEDVDDIIVALEQHDRVCEIDLDGFPGFDLFDTVVSSMLVPFPALKRLSLIALPEIPVPVFPDNLLGGSAPRLQSLHFSGIPFPALPNLLLSAGGLVDLTLQSIPRTGTFLPETIVNCISHLSRLESLCLEFDSRQSCPVPRRRSPPVARAVFPALFRLSFEGVAEYLDDFISRIDAPLNLLRMTFFNQAFVTSDFCQLRQFIDRAEKFKSLTHACINFRGSTVEVSLSQRTESYDPHLSVRIRSKNLHPQLQSLAEVGSASLLPLSKVESLELSSDFLTWELQLHAEHTEEDSRWLNVFQPFSAVNYLYARVNTLPSFAYALQEVAEDRLTEVLPALQGLSMEVYLPPGPVDRPSAPAAIERFIAMRGLHTTRVFHKYWLDD